MEKPLRTKWSASAAGDTPFLQSLSSDDDLNEEDIYGLTPLHYAVYNNQFETAQHLIQHSARVVPSHPNRRTDHWMSMSQIAAENPVLFYTSVDSCDLIKLHYKNYQPWTMRYKQGVSGGGAYYCEYVFDHKMSDMHVGFCSAYSFVPSGKNNLGGGDTAFAIAWDPAANEVRMREAFDIVDAELPNPHADNVLGCYIVFDDPGRTTPPSGIVNQERIGGRQGGQGRDRQGWEIPFEHWMAADSAETGRIVHVEFTLNGKATGTWVKVDADILCSTAMKLNDKKWRERTVGNHFDDWRSDSISESVAYEWLTHDQRLREWSADWSIEKSEHWPSGFDVEQIEKEHPHKLEFGDNKLYPAITLGSARCHINWGQEPWRYPPPAHYKPMRTAFDEKTQTLQAQKLPLPKGSALHWAATKGNLDIAQLLVESMKKPATEEMDIELLCHRDAYNRTALDIACFYGHSEMARFLLKHWPDAAFIPPTITEAYDKDSKHPGEGKHLLTPLHHLLCGKSYDASLVSMLVDKIPIGDTAAEYTFYAAVNNKIEQMKALIQKGFSVNAHTPDGFNALIGAAFDLSDSYDMVKFLIPLTDDIFEDGPNAAFITALRHLRPPALQLFLDLPESRTYVQDARGYDWPPLAYCMYKFNRGAFHVLLENGADIHCFTKDGTASVFDRAVSSGSPQAVEMLVKKGADLCRTLPATDTQGGLMRVRSLTMAETMFDLAKERGIPETEYFEKQLGQKAIAYLVFSHNLETVKYLLTKEGADVNGIVCIGVDACALTTAVAVDDRRTVSYLLSQGAAIDIQMKSAQMAPPVLLPALLGNLVLAKMLLPLTGLPLDAQPFTLNILELACRSGHAPTIKYVFEYIASDACTILEEFKTPEARAEPDNAKKLFLAMYSKFHCTSQLSWCATNGHYHALVYLLQYGVGHLTATTRRTLLHNTADSGSVPQMHFLLSIPELKELLPNVLSGSTVIARACTKGRLSMVKYLIETAGVDVLQEKDSPMCKAIHSGNIQLIKYLAERLPATIHETHVRSPTDTTQSTVVEIAAACEHDQPKLIDVLVEHGALIDAAEETEGKSALMLAASNGHLKKMKHLITKYGVPPTQRNRINHTSLFYALTSKQAAQVVKYLTKESGASFESLNGPEFLSSLMRGAMAIAANGTEVLVSVWEPEQGEYVIKGTTRRFTSPAAFYSALEKNKHVNALRFKDSTMLDNGHKLSDTLSEAPHLHYLCLDADDPTYHSSLLSNLNDGLTSGPSYLHELALITKSEEKLADEAAQKKCGADQSSARSQQAAAQGMCPNRRESVDRHSRIINGG